MWWGFAIILVKANGLEAFRVDVEAELSPECWEAISIGWSPVSFLEGARFLPGVDDVPSVVPCCC